MTIREFLDKYNVSVYKFAKIVGVTREYMYRVVKGQSNPGRYLAQHIEKLTNGEVKVSDIVHKEEKKLW